MLEAEPLCFEILSALALPKIWTNSNHYVVWDFSRGATLGHCLTISWVVLLFESISSCLPFCRHYRVPAQVHGRKRREKVIHLVQPWVKEFVLCAVSWRRWMKEEEERRRKTYYFTTLKFTEPRPGNFFGPWRYSDLWKTKPDTMF